MQQAHEDWLLAELKTGNETAFSEIYRRYYTPLRLEAYYRLRNDAEAEDVVQDVFTSLWARKEKLPDIAFKTYLFQAVRNRCIDKIRKNATHHHYTEQLKDLPEPSTRYIAIEHKELSRQLKTVISGIPPAQRKAFELSYLEDKSNRQISEELGTSLQTVKNNLTSALKTLRNKLINLHNA
ncbi:RNA polymerase sigma-70 factor [Chitinophaga japonensis]|uniref:RNA polymerase sigma-70 factor (ECF subfamily) n=1 Tax=Chitinophaga japonensis TaxID=104662 RepID=A0A562ST95_CHIJA|nr:RNA polymerase sigma-70 factor [Chitinophaga japonensis]TWI84363.1 RNA polymerase sigma-70 factor (ECF subfamily) [Chitinophaga japonensis]